MIFQESQFVHLLLSYLTELVGDALRWNSRCRSNNDIGSGNTTIDNSVVFFYCGCVVP